MHICTAQQPTACVTKAHLQTPAQGCDTSIAAMPALMELTQTTIREEDSTLPHNHPTPTHSLSPSNQLAAEPIMVEGRH